MSELEQTVSQKLDSLKNLYNVDRMRDNIRQATGKNPADEDVVSFITKNWQSSRFEADFAISTDDMNIQLDEIAQEYRAKAAKAKKQAYSKIPIVSAGSFGGGMESLKQFASFFISGDEGQSAKELGASATALEDAGEVLGKSIEGEQSFDVEGSSGMDAVFEGLKSFDLSQEFLTKDQTVVNNLMKLIDPQVDEEGVITNKQYDQRVADIFKSKFIQRVQSNGDAIIEGTFDLVGELPWFMLASAVGAPFAQATIKGLSKTLSIAKKAKSVGRFANALNAVAKYPKIYGKLSNVLAKEGVKISKAGELAVGVTKHAIDDAMMFTNMELFKDQHVGWDAPLSGMAFGIAGGLSRSMSAKVADKLIKVDGAGKMRKMANWAVANGMGMISSGVTFGAGSSAISVAMGEYQDGVFTHEAIKGALLNRLMAGGKFTGTGILKSFRYGAEKLGTGSKNPFTALDSKQTKKFASAQGRVMAEIAKVSPETAEKLREYALLSTEERLGIKREEIVDADTGKTYKWMGKNEQGEPIWEETGKTVEKDGIQEPPSKSSVSTTALEKEIRDNISKLQKEGKIPLRGEDALAFLQGDGETAMDLVKDGFHKFERDEKTGKLKLVLDEEGIASYVDYYRQEAEISKSTSNVLQGLKEAELATLKKQAGERLSGQERDQKIITVNQALGEIKSKGFMPNHMIQALKNRLTPEATDNEIAGVLEETMLYSRYADRIVTPKNLKDLMAHYDWEINVQDIEQRTGYAKLISTVGKVSEELGIRDNAKKLDVAGRLIDMAKEHQNSDEYVSAIVKLKTEVDAKDIVDVEVSSMYEKMLSVDYEHTLRGLHRAVTSRVQYSENTIQAFSPVWSEGKNGKPGSWNVKKLSEYDEKTTGEYESFVSKIFAGEVMKIKFNERGNHDGEVLDITELNAGERVKFISDMKSKGWFPLFTKGASSTMFFAKLDPKIGKALDKAIDRKKATPEAYTEELGNLLKAELPNDAKALLKASTGSKYMNKDDFLKNALNIHFRLKSYMGENYRDYLEGDDLGDITNIIRRFQIPAFGGLRFNEGEVDGKWSGRIIEDSDARSVIYGDDVNKAPKETTDGGVYIEQKTYDRMMNLLGNSEGEFLKAFVHEIGEEQGAIGFKAGFFRATPEQQKYLSGNNLNWVAYGSAVKYKGGRQVGETITTDPTSWRFGFGEHYDFKHNRTREKGEIKVNYVDAPRQFVSMFYEDPTNTVFKQFSAELEKNNKEASTKFSNAMATPEKAGKHIMEILNLEKNQVGFDELSKENALAVDDYSNPVSPAERMLLAMNTTYGMHLPWAKDYVRRAVTNHYMRKTMSPKMIGSASVLRPSEEFNKILEGADGDSKVILGHEWKNFVIPFGSYKGKDRYMPLGKIYEVQEFIENNNLLRRQNLGLQYIGEKKVSDILKEKGFDSIFKSYSPEYIEKALNVMVTRTPQENRAGARALRIGGFGEEGTGMQTMVSAENMRKLGGADHDGDKVHLISAVDRQYMWSWLKDPKNSNWATEGYENLDKKIAGEHDKTKLGTDSIYNIDTQMESIINNINGKKGLELVAGTKKIHDIILAHGIDIISDVKGVRLDDRSILSGKAKIDPNKPYTITLTGSDKLEELSGVDMPVDKSPGDKGLHDSTVDRMRMFMERIVKKHPNIIFATTANRGFDEIVVKVAQETGIPVKIYTTKNKGRMASNLHKEVTEWADSEVNRKMGGGVYRTVTEDNVSNRLATDSHEVWTFDVENDSRQYNNRVVKIGNLAKEANKTIVSMPDYMLRGLENKSVSREDMDYTFAYWIRKAADSGKYGGLPAKSKVKADMLGELHGIENELSKLIFAKRLDKSNGKYALARKTLSALQGGKDIDGALLPNAEILNLSNRYRQRMGEPKSGLEWGMFNVINTDLSILNQVSRIRFMEVIEGQRNIKTERDPNKRKYGVPEGGVIKRWNFLHDSSFSTDESIARRPLTPILIEREMEEVYTFLNDRKSGTEPHRLLAIAGGRGNKKIYLNRTKDLDDFKFQLKQKMKENPGLYRRLVMDIKDETEDMVFKDIHQAVSIDENNRLRAKIWNAFSHDKDQAALKMKEIDNLAAKYVAQYDEISKGRRDKPHASVEDAMNGLLTEIKMAATAFHYPPAVRDYFWFSLMDSRSKKLTSTIDTPFSGKFSKLASESSILPADYSRQLGNAGQNMIKRLRGSQIAGTVDYSQVQSLTPVMRKVTQAFHPAIERLKDMTNQTQADKLRRGMDYIKATLADWKKYPHIVHQGIHTPEDWIKAITDRGFDDIRKNGLSQREHQALLDGARLLRLGERLYTKPEGKVMKAFHEQWRKFVHWQYLPESIMQRSPTTKKAFDDLSDVYNDSERRKSYLDTLVDTLNGDIEKVVAAEFDRAKLSENAETVQEVRQRINDQFRGIIEGDFDPVNVSKNIMNSVETWATKKNKALSTEENLDGLSPRDFLHNTLQETRDLKLRLLDNLIKSKSTNLAWASHWLGIPIEELSKWDRPRLDKRIEGSIASMFESMEERETDKVGYLKTHYPRFRKQDGDMELAEDIHRFDEDWRYLKDENLVNADELRSIIQKTPESGHAMKRTSDAPTQPANVESDLKRYIKGVIQANTRMRLLNIGSDTVNELMNGMKYDPANKDYVERTIKYVNDLVDHSVGGSRSKELSMKDDLLTSLTNFTFATSIGTNVASGIRNLSQLGYTWIAAGHQATVDGLAWRGGKTLRSVDGKDARSYIDVIKEIGVIDYGLAEQSGSVNKLTENMSHVMKVSRARMAQGEAEVQAERAGELLANGEITKDQYDKTVAATSKRKAAIEKRIKIAGVTGKIEGFTSEISQKSAEMFNIPVLKKVAFKTTEKFNRTVTAAIGYHQGYTKAEKEYQLQYGDSDMVKMDEYAHGMGIKRARALVKLTQFEYHSFNMPESMRKPFGKAMMQFRSFTWNWTAMMWKMLGRDVKDWHRGGDPDGMKRAVGTLGWVGALSLMDAYLLQGFGNAWQAEPVDKTLALIGLIAGDEDAAYGRGWAGFLASFPGAGFQVATDIAIAAADKKRHSEFFGHRDAFEYQMNNKYGWAIGNVDPYFAVPSYIFGYTPSKLMNVAAKAAVGKGRFSTWEEIGKLIGTKSRVFYRYNKKRKMKF